MKRPIEKFGWKYDNTFCMDTTQMRFEKNSNKEYLIFNRVDGRVCIDSGISTLSIEELQTIYETAKQIKEEYGRTKKDSRV